VPFSLAECWDLHEGYLLLSDKLLEAAFTSSKGKPANSESPSASPPDKYLGRQRRWALLVGVSAYEDSSYSPLPVCQYDAKELAQQLSQSESGFTPESWFCDTPHGLKPSSF
jgi:hypothetical protein